MSDIILDCAESREESETGWYDKKFAWGRGHGRLALFGWIVEGDTLGSCWEWIIRTSQPDKDLRSVVLGD